MADPASTPTSAPTPASATAATPSKPVNRLKPFTRINNDARVVQASESPDGNGVACGCHLPDEFDNLEGKFKDFIDKKLPLPLLKVLDKVKEIAEAAADAAKAAATIAALALAALGSLPGNLGGPIVGFLAFVKVFSDAVKAINSFVSQVLKIITDVIHTFFEKLGADLARRAIRVIPQWVPVKKGASSQNITSDQIKDIEGIVTRSYGDPIEPPFFQWHHWLNWSVQVIPEDRYKNVLVPGFKLNTDGKKGAEQSIIQDSTFEIQWDVGALWDPPMTMKGKGTAGNVVIDPFEAGFDEDQMPDVDGPMTSSVSPTQKGAGRAPSDWIWPMTGMYVWASGRWVYDCSRTDTTAKGSKPKMVSMMNPPRAIATACFEARQFAENLPGETTPGISTKVPAIRFMFLTCKRGGYMSYDSISDEDYEFILDLPPLDLTISPFPIGHTFAHERPTDPPDDFPHNTIVLRPRLLKELQPLGGDANVRSIDPIIELLPPPKVGAVPQQAKVTIKGSAIAAQKANAAGFILSLGWFDPNRTQAAKVKDCAVTFSRLHGRLQVDRDSPVALIRRRFKPEIEDAKKKIAEQVKKIKIPVPFGQDVSIDALLTSDLPEPAKTVVRGLGQKLQDVADAVVNAAFDGLLDELAKVVAGTQTEEWLLRVGVNGRWQTRFLGDVSRNDAAIPDPYQFNLSLGPDDLLFFSSGGVEFNPVGDMMRARRTDRLVRKMDQNGNDLDPFTWNEIVNVSGVQHTDLIFNYVLKVIAGNSATGLLALGIENTVLGIIDPGDSGQSVTNPITMQKAQSGSVLPVANFAEATSEDTGDEHILVTDPGRQDYRLTGVVNVQPQKFQ